MRQALWLLLSFYRWGNWGWFLVLCANLVALWSPCCNVSCISIPSGGRGCAWLSSHPQCPALEVPHCSLCLSLFCVPNIRAPSWVWRNNHCVSPRESHLSLQKPNGPDICFPGPCNSASLSSDSIWDTNTYVGRREAEILPISSQSWWHLGPWVLGCSRMELQVQWTSGQWQPGQIWGWHLCVSLTPPASPSVLLQAAKPESLQ